MLFWKWISDTHDWERAQAEIRNYEAGEPGRARTVGRARACRSAGLSAITRRAG
jgi:hypothetical protein